MRALDIIIKKRNGDVLSANEIKFLLQEYTNGNIPDYQMSAFAMSVFFKGMSPEEIAIFTKSMLHSGTVLDLSHLEGIPVDKHSTGGVGDKISIPLAPAVAALGVPVPMISGRGLGHTGGTLDKLESIPGFSCKVTVEQFITQVENIGCCFGAATKEIAPADKKLYELRDVTGTVECIPLICSSIMSKKLAEGIKGLVLDVKFGQGAFMSDPKDAEQLAKTMVEIGTNMGTQTVARLTSMEEPIGTMIGHGLEIQESIETLKGKGPDDTRQLVVELGAEMLLLAQKVTNIEDGRKAIAEVLDNGKALKKFVEIIEAQGGNSQIVDNYELLVQAKYKTNITADESGYISSINSYDLGMANVLLGGGRAKTSDTIDPSVGIEVKVKVGDKIKAGQPLCIMHSSRPEEKAAHKLIKNSFAIKAKSVSKPTLFGPRITSMNL